MDEMKLNLTFTIIAAAIYAVIIVLHVLPLFLKGRGSHALSFVCVGLHIPLMPLMLLAGFTLEVMILAYAASAFVHTLGRFILYTLATRGSTRGDDGEADE